ncbi:toprim domain-containing protein [Rhodopseudomonas sp. P2A-2r]|uniref:DUF7146 domain-containing protein n=1 Tax=Rhodopseudomonas sp. P2A-2r TaxID=2991972 RepID=UPI0022347621|nr:toprim domain-containing protein [Rhodopseudomonas sp. P2A-2r]UZE47930.1 toprim domain-containing protein [Rhodopseudomonas sp. P2A-2r]
MSIDLRTKQGFEDVKRHLDDRPDEVLAVCGITLPAKRGGTILIDDPRGQGKNNFALWLRADGLSWKNYTTDEKGRSLELIAYVNGWYHLDRRGGVEAARYAVDRFGLGRINNADLDRDRALAKEKVEQAQKDASAELKRAQAWAFKTFMEARPILDSAGETYLREARGVDLRAAPFIGPRGGSIAPHSLRFLPEHPYVHRDKAGNQTARTRPPCMIACCVDRDMKIVALHQTWLRADGRGKAVFSPAPDGTLQPARKVFPSSAGAVLPLWKGTGQGGVTQALESFKNDGVVETLVLTEGVEDGLSAVLAAPQHRTWGMISLSNMAHVAGRLPEFTDAVIVHQQNDWMKSAAVAQFERGMSAMRATGRMVATVAAYGGKDLNDTLRGED